MVCDIMLCMTTIVLADNHPLIRRYLREILETTPDLTLLGETGDGSEVVDLVVRLQPDVLVLDIAMPGMNGLEITRRIAARSLRTHVVICSSHRFEGYVLQAMKNGASAYVAKDCSVDDLVPAIHKVTCGKRFLSPSLYDCIRSLNQTWFDVA
ncbi:MAG: response regulator transcription factor [Chloroflexota bacterium]|nr:response regulator transcription factor [Chloroflexota bacterium]